jgi:RsiW-degrading membrane proteinase PrsW (M82 family)
MPSADSMNRKLRISGILVIIGLLAEAVCLGWSRPIAFVVLVCLGGALIGLGVLLFLYSLVSGPSHPANASGVAEDKH